MIRRYRHWLSCVDEGYPRALSQVDALHSALGGVIGSVAGLAIGMIILRPLLTYFGFEGAWR